MQYQFSKLFILARQNNQQQNSILNQINPILFVVKTKYYDRQSHKMNKLTVPRTNQIYFNNFNNKQQKHSILQKKYIMDSGQPNSLHQQLFQTQLQSLLTYITKPCLNYQQLYLIYYQSNIKFINEHEQNKIKQLFAQKHTLSLRECLSLIQLHSCEIVHNRPMFRVKVSSQVLHQEKICFQFWKTVMKKKYGSTMKWFDAIAGKIQARKTKCYHFRSRIKQILKDTAHQVCADSICLKFPKNVKNEVEWGTFMAVARYRPNKYKKSLTNITFTDSIQLKQQQEFGQKQKFPYPKLNNYLYQTVNSFSRYRQSQRSKSRIKTLQGKNYENQQQFIPNLHLKSSIQIGRQYEQITKKFGNSNKYKQIRAHSAKWIKSSKDKKDKQNSKQKTRQSKQKINKTIDSIESNRKQNRWNKNNTKFANNLGINKIDNWDSIFKKIVDYNKIKSKQSTSFTAHS